MATRLKNVDEIVSANNTKTTVLDYTPVVVTPASGVAEIDLSLGNNFTVAGATTLSFTGMSGREGQSGTGQEAERGEAETQEGGSRF